MPRMLVHVEGQTEENFVNNVLAPHLYRVGYTSVSARLVGNARQRRRRGGIKPWDAVRRDIVTHLRSDQAAFATTMVDYYRLPHTWPGRKKAGRRVPLSSRDRAKTVEGAILDDIAAATGDQSRFVPHVVMHEFEGLLFSDPDRFAECLGRPDLAAELWAIRDEFESPEDINDSPDTAPSRRIQNLYPSYRKPVMGLLAIREIGLEAVRGACPLFSEWLATLEQRVRQ